MVIRLAQRYSKLPSEVLEENMDWIRLMLTVENLDQESGDLNEKRNKLRNKQND